MVAFSAMNAAHAKARRGAAAAAATGGGRGAAATAEEGGDSPAVVAFTGANEISSSSGLLIGPLGGGSGGDAAAATSTYLVSEDLKLFKPERWLITDKTKARANLETGSIAAREHANGVLPPENHPFGMGQRYCLGWALATAELTVMLSELVRGYEVKADTNTSWGDYPILNPRNGLPTTLTPL
jgi:hypothetical protein